MAIRAIRVAQRPGFGRFPAGQQHRGFSQIPGVTYSFGGKVYVSLTNECPAELTMLAANGPGFAFPKGSGFQPLGAGVEPSGEQVANQALELIRELNMKDKTRFAGREVVFAGMGEPLYRIPEFRKAVQTLNKLSNKQQLVEHTNLDTFGLIKAENAHTIAHFLREAGLSKANVRIQTADPDQYQELVKPFHGLHHSDACAFVEALVFQHIETTISAVGRPGVDLDALEKLAEDLGAKGFIKRPYHP